MPLPPKKHAIGQTVVAENGFVILPEVEFRRLVRSAARARAAAARRTGETVPPLKTARALML
jgi:hypothetical protein